MDVVDATTARPQWLTQIGGRYLDGRTVQAGQVGQSAGSMDLIFEATGIAKLEFSLLDALAFDGAYVITGIPGGDRPLEIPAAELIRQLVLKNQLMLGSVNAARGHFEMGVNDLMAAHRLWGAHLDKLITGRHAPERLSQAFLQHDTNAIKDVIQWSPMALQ